MDILEYGGLTWTFTSFLKPPETCMGISAPALPLAYGQPRRRAGCFTASCAARYESRACWADGFQSVLGATVGNGRLCLRETGKPVFNFYGAGGELRLYLRPLPKLADKSALIEYILTAPAAEIFCSGIPHMPFPAAPQRRDERPCAVCGELTREDFLQIRCGVPVCADCAEKQSPDR